jgi:hypothetical protein
VEVGVSRQSLHSGEVQDNASLSLVLKSADSLGLLLYVARAFRFLLVLAEDVEAMVCCWWDSRVDPQSLGVGGGRKLRSTPASTVAADVVSKLDLYQRMYRII